jgi:hypothetical protein
MQVLIAFPTQSIELADELGERLRLGASEAGQLYHNSEIAWYGERALKLFGNAPFTHCIIHDELPANRSDAPAPGGGFELAARVRERNKEMPIYLFSNRPAWTDAEVMRQTELNLRAVKNSEAGLALIVQQVVSVGLPRPRTQYIDITIDLSQRLDGIKYQITSLDVPAAERQGSLLLRQDQIDIFEHLSNELERNPEWEKALERLSSNLHGSLIEAHHQFKAALMLALGKECDDVKSRLHFRIDERQFDVVYEALQHPAKKGYWMVRSPVFRSLVGGNTQVPKPIFSDASQRKLSCLIILSEAAGRCEFFNENQQYIGEGNYRDLSRAREECDDIERLLKVKHAAAVGDVKVIGRKMPLTLKDLEENLAPGRWDIVHYIGHTDYLAPRGYLLLPGVQPSTVVSIGIESVAPRLEDTRLVYLSSCEGTKVAFVKRLTEQRVPTIFGFRSRVRDDLAREHAREFYDRLFQRSSIEQAYQETKTYFYENHRSERMWACSSLIMQYN